MQHHTLGLAIQTQVAMLNACAHRWQVSTQTVLSSAIKPENVVIHTPFAQLS